MTDQLAASLLSGALFLAATIWDVIKAGNGR